MADNEREIYDEDREEVLRLILAEAGGADVRRELENYPVSVRNQFRKVVQEAGMVEAPGLRKGDGGELFFDAPAKLTPRGRKRLDELNARRGSSNGHAL